MKVVSVVFLSITFCSVIGQNTVESYPDVESGTRTTQERATSATKDGQVLKEPVDDFDPTSKEWGTYYDPKNKFCGNYDCYKILGFDFDAGAPDRKLITQRYRKISRIFHPDKADKKKFPDAKERFVKIARAYEVLTDQDQRKEYDDLRYNQELYMQRYGASVLWTYAPKSDTTIVILVILILGNLFSWYSQKHRWQLVANRLIQAAVEDWTTSQGGSPESKQLREEATKIMLERQPSDLSTGSETTPSSGKNKKKSAGKKVSGKDRKKQEEDALRPIVTELVNAMHDFGSGFHQPTWRDLFIVSLIKLPYRITKGAVWQYRYWIRRLQGKPLSDEEKLALTESSVGPIVWDAASDEERQELLGRELWITENLAEWCEEQEIKKLSAADQKYYYKLKKKGMLDKMD